MSGAIVACPYCGERAVLHKSSAAFYGGRNFGPLYACEPCDARVGCHPGTERPLGRLANAELRAAKVRAHDAFDRLWKLKAARQGCKRSHARSLGYQWLAKQLGVPPEQCHIGMFDVEACERVVTACSGGRA